MVTHVAGALFIEEHAGYTISLMLTSGVYRADVDGAFAESDSLPEMRRKLTAITEKAKKRSRASYEPVPFVMVTQEKREYSVKRVDITGIVPRRYSLTLKTKQGHIEPLKGTVVGLHPNDARVQALEQCIQAVKNAVQAQTNAEKALEQFLESVAHVKVPRVETADDALDREPGFLEALRAVKPQEVPA